MLEPWEHLALSRVCRKLLGEQSCRPVILVKGNSKPRLAGTSYYWTTLSGKTIVRYPKAYKWPTRYWPSTRCFEVGRQWAHRWLRSHADLVMLARLEGMGNTTLLRDARKALRALRYDTDRLNKIGPILGTLELSWL